MKGRTLNNMESGRRTEELDLTPILRNLADQRGTPKAKHRLANDEITRLFLTAGISALSTHLGAATGSLVLQEARRIDSEQGTHLAPNDAKFRDRWPHIEKYQADLLSYCLAWQHWSLHLNDEAALKKQLSQSPSFYDAVQEVTYHDLEYTLDQDSSKASFLISLSASSDPETRRAIRETNQELRGQWERLCTHIYDQKQASLRPETTIRQLAELLVILADGIAFRALSDEDSGLIDRDKRASLFGIGAAALLAGLTDPGDGKSLKETLDDMGRN